VVYCLALYDHLVVSDLRVSQEGLEVIQEIQRLCHILIDVSIIVVIIIVECNRTLPAVLSDGLRERGSAINNGELLKVVHNFYEKLEEWEAFLNSQIPAKEMVESKESKLLDAGVA
jgi:hypothetical protein